MGCLRRRRREAMTGSDKLTGFEPMLGGEDDSSMSGDEPSLSTEFGLLRIIGVMDDIAWEDSTRRERMQAIRNRGKTVLPALLKLCQNDDVRVAESAITIVGQIGDPTAIPALIEALQNPRLALAASTTAVALARIGIVAEPVLLALLGDPHLPTYNGAIFALSRIGSKKAAPELIRRMYSATERPTLKALISSVRLISDRDALPMLEALVDNPNPLFQDLFIQDEMFRTFNHLGGLESIDSLLWIYPKTNQTRELMAILGQSKDPRVRPILIQSLRSANTGARKLSAIYGLMDLDHPLLVDEIEPFLSDQDMDVRFAAGEAIRRLKRR
jgi:HEAT repeat protein